MTDFVNDFSYRVLPLNKAAPPDGFETLVDPEDAAASPNGWITEATTSGPNARAFSSDQNNTSSATGPAEFVYNWDNATSPTADNNLAAARVNAFFLANSIHDLAFRYGFTPATFNFQDDDPVLVKVQDPSSVNNAQFYSRCFVTSRSRLSV